MNLTQLQNQFANALLYQASGNDCDVSADQFSADERMQIYRNNFIISLSEVLSAAYPMVETLLGKECFAQIARQHVLHHPLTEGHVTHYGEGFEQTITLFAHVMTRAPYSPEVARFEWNVDLARQTQREQQRNTELIPLTQLAVISADQQPRLILHLNTGCRSFDSDYAVFDLFAAIRCQDFEQLDINQAQCGVISVDQHNNVLCHRLDRDTFQLLRCLEQKHPLGDIPSAQLANLHCLMQLGLINGASVQKR